MSLVLGDLQFDVLHIPLPISAALQVLPKRRIEGKGLP
jgi:hypothetical protein